MRFKLSYHVGNKILQEWVFTSKSLCYWKKSDLLNTGMFNDGIFKITEI